MDHRDTLRAADQDASDEWTRAVLRSIGAIRDNVGDEHSLQTLAQVAWLSPFQFHRVFQKVTDSTPARFLAAWRMAEAKRLLAYTSDSVTDVCMQIGYSSLGTFTSQFTRVVGVPPGRFRRLLAVTGEQPFNKLLAEVGDRRAGPRRPQLTVTLDGDLDVTVPTAIGLFPTGIPQQSPASCAVAQPPGEIALGDLPDGAYRVRAMCFDDSVTVAEAVATVDLDRCFVGAGDHIVAVAGGEAVAGASVPVRLRARRPIDPPLILALPVLLEAGLQQTSAGCRPERNS